MQFTTPLRSKNSFVQSPLQYWGGGDTGRWWEVPCWYCLIDGKPIENHTKSRCFTKHLKDEMVVFRIVDIWHQKFGSSNCGSDL